MADIGNADLSDRQVTSLPEQKQFTPERMRQILKLSEPTSPPISDRLGCSQGAISANRASTWQCG